MAEENKTDAPNPVESYALIKPLSPLEKVRVGYLIHMGDPYIIAEETGLSILEVQKHLEFIRESECKDIRQYTAANVARYIIAGVEMRMYHLSRQLKAINGRDQMWRSVCCRKPVEDVPATPGSLATATTPEVLPTPAFKRCLGCRLGCNIELIDYPTIYRVRNETMRSIREETVLYMAALEKMHIIESQPTYIQNVDQKILVVGGQPQDYLKLGPMEMDRLLSDLKKELVRMDSEIKKSDDEIAKEELEIKKEEGQVGREQTDVGGTETAPGTTQAGEGAKETGTAEKTG